MTVFAEWWLYHKSSSCTGLLKSGKPFLRIFRSKIFVIFCIMPQHWYFSRFCICFNRVFHTVGDVWFPRIGVWPSSPSSRKIDHTDQPRRIDACSCQGSKASCGLSHQQNYIGFHIWKICGKGYGCGNILSCFQTCSGIKRIIIMMAKPRGCLNRFMFSR
jgi:hypothetical protein